MKAIINVKTQRPHIGVFCSSSHGVTRSHLALAERFGAAIARAGYHLVWGGCQVSTMGAVARGVQKCGGRVCGVIPTSMIKRGLAYSDADEMIRVTNLGTRKKVMKQRSDAFAILPGGIGTLDEFFDVFADQVIALKHGKRTKPIFIMNSDGFYNPLVALLERLYETKMADASYRQLYHVVSTPSDAVKKLHAILKHS